MRSRPSRWKVDIGALSILVVSLVSLSTDSSPDIFPAANVWTRVTPSVLWCGVVDSTATIEVHVVGRADVLSVMVVGPNETYELYDDGTHGDVLAGDLAFSLSGVRPFCHTGLSLKYGGTIGSWSGTLEMALADGTTVNADRPISIGFVQPRYRGSADVVYYLNGLSATATAFFIQDIDGAVFDGYPVSSTDPRTASCAALRVLYSRLPDVFDLAIVMPGRTMFSSDGFSTVELQTLRTANDVEHIGVPIYNEAASAGSAGRLRGAIVLAFSAIDFLDSEILNIWGADLGVSLGFAQTARSGSVFWDPYCDIGGQLSSYVVSEDGAVGRLVPNVDGTWKLASIAENAMYAPLELYIMGLVPAADVPPVHLLSGPDLSDSERISATAVQTVAIEDIVAAQGGVRSPTPEESPKTLTVAFVVVQDEPFSDAEYAYYSLLAQHLMTHDAPGEFDMYAPFFWATGGRAALDTRLPVGAKPILEP